MQENAIRELVQQKRIKIEHVSDILNLSDLFTKDMKDISHFFISSQPYHVRYTYRGDTQYKSTGYLYGTYSSYQGC